MRRAGVIAFVLALAAFVVFAAVPFLTKKRDQPSAVTSPSPLQFVSLDVIKPRQQLCMDDITIEPHSRQARFRVGTYGKSGPPIAVDMSGSGFRASATIGGGYPDNKLQTIPVDPPPASELIRVCFRNQGRVKIALYSAGDRARSRAIVSEAGHAVYPTPAFGFWDGKPRSIAGEAGLTAQRIAVFRGPLGYTWVVWLVAALTLLGLTVGLALALWREAL